MENNETLTVNTGIKAGSDEDMAVYDNLGDIFADFGIPQM
jgi:hypothetical protein|tara:strand:- start:643 stop:762 length:120 start_codon:yes stop_codon:yes gene_type:complete